MRYTAKIIYKLSRPILRFVKDVVFRHKHNPFVFEVLHKIYVHYAPRKHGPPCFSLPDIVHLMERPTLNKSFHWRNGNISDNELGILCAIVKKLSPSQCFEIGTFNGRTSYHIAINCSSHSIVNTLDLFNSAIKPKLNLDSRDSYFIQQGKVDLGAQEFWPHANVNRLSGDSASFNYEAFMGEMQFVFIDGSHSADYVANDSEIALRLIGNNYGIIIWHDYNGIYWNGVTQVLNELFAKDIRFRKLFTIADTTLAVLVVNEQP